MGKFVFSFANSTVQRTSLNLLNTQKELTGIFKQQSNLESEWLPNITIQSFSELFIEESKKGIETFQFSGHGNIEQFHFLDEKGTSTVKVNAMELAPIFGSSPNLKLLVLDCCNSLEIAKQCIKAGVKVVIGTSDKIYDEASSTLNKYFWQCIVAGYKIQDAFEEALHYFNAQNNKALEKPVWEIITNPNCPEANYYSWNIDKNDLDKRIPNDSHYNRNTNKLNKVAKSFIANEFNNSGTTNIDFSG